MINSLYSYFFLALIVFQVIPGVFFYIQKKRIIIKCRQPDSRQLKRIKGTIILENGFLRKNFRWCSFEILLNNNSIFLFPKDFYFIPGRFINLTLSSDKRDTKRPTLLREFSIDKHTVVLISYLDFINSKRTIYLKNLTSEQIIIFSEFFQSRIH